MPLNHGACGRRRAIVVHEDPTAGYRVADRLAFYGYEAILARQIDDVQPHVAHIRPNLIVVDLELSGSPALLSRLQSVCPFVPIIGMLRPDGQAVEQAARTLREADPLSSDVFVCTPSDSKKPQALRL